MWLATHHSHVIQSEFHRKPQFFLNVSSQFVLPHSCLFLSSLSVLSELRCHNSAVSIPCQLYWSLFQGLTALKSAADKTAAGFANMGRAFSRRRPPSDVSATQDPPVRSARNAACCPRTDTPTQCDTTTTASGLKMSLCSFDSWQVTHSQPGSISLPKAS